MIINYQKRRIIRIISVIGPFILIHLNEVKLVGKKYKGIYFHEVEIL